MKNIRLEVCVFLTGAAVMALEILGSRILAPYLGTSIIVWTSLIGVVMASLSLGYFFGGKLADKKPKYEALSLIILCAAIYIGLSAFLKEQVLIFIRAWSFDLRLSAILASLFLLSPPSLLLGMVSPYAVRLKVRSVNKSGKVTGNLYAISTLGSIFGTFLAGFFLIAYFGHTMLLVGIALVLLVASLVVFTGDYKFRLFVFLFIIGSFWASPQVARNMRGKDFIDIDTNYNRVFIYNSNEPKTQRPIKVMVFDPKLTQAAMFLDSDELVFGVNKFFRLGGYFKSDLKRTLMLGGAAYSYPKDFLNQYSSARMDVVEIDPMLTDLAKRYFRLKENDRLQVFHEDARTFLNRQVRLGANVYDLVYVDVFSSTSSIPFQVTTKEAVADIFKLLEDNGVVLVNLISTIDGDGGKFLRAQYQTYRSVFRQVYLFPVANQDPTIAQNIVLVAMKGNKVPDFISVDGEINGYLSHLYKGAISNDVPILTDDYAPVDNYLLKIL